jgi:Methane oxygenase PmoA
MCRNFCVRLLGVVASLACAAQLPAQSPNLPIHLTVTSSSADRTDAVVSHTLSPALANRGDLRLIETTGGTETPIAAQLDAQAGRLYWIATGKTPAGSKRTYRLEAGPPVQGEGITTTNSPAAVEASWSGKPLLRYNKAHVESPAGVNPRYGRSAHLHPVWTPSGAIVTDELPPDHLHQSGVFLSYTKTNFEGREVDFWNLGGGKGRVRFKELTGVASGPVFGQIRTLHEHVDLTADNEKSEIGATSGGKVALVEAWDLRIWSAGLKSGYWLLDINSSASCASDSPLKLPEYHYGGMAIRAARPWTPQHVQFLTSEGDERIKGNHTRPRWCDIHGQIDGRPVGIALLTHPTNFRFPEPLRIHPTMPYMVYTPSFLGDWEIRPGAPNNSRYRLIIHDGELSSQTLDQLWQDFAAPLIAKTP